MKKQELIQIVMGVKEGVTESIFLLVYEKITKDLGSYSYHILEQALDSSECIFGENRYKLADSKDFDSIVEEMWEARIKELNNE